MKVQYGESRFRWHLCRSCCLHSSRWWELGKKFNSKEEQVTKNTEDQLSAAAATGGSAVKEIRALAFVQAQEANFTVFCLFGVLNLGLNCICSEYTGRCLVKSCNFCQLHHFKKKKHFYICSMKEKPLMRPGFPRIAQVSPILVFLSLLNNFS